MREREWARYTEAIKTYDDEFVLGVQRRDRVDKKQNSPPVALPIMGMLGGVETHDENYRN